MLDKEITEVSGEEIIACLARHEIAEPHFREEFPFTLASEMGLIDATILTDMLRNIPGVFVSLNEHKNEDGNLALVDLIQESVALANSMVELLSQDSAIAVGKLQSRQ